MRFFITLFLLHCFISSAAQKDNYARHTLLFGFEYRQYPIDIENVPRGPLPSPKGLPDFDSKFWRPISIYGQYGLLFKKSWLLSASLYGRYNTLHRIQNLNYSQPLPKNIKRKKNFKYDFFLDVEKKLRLKKHKENYLLVSAGLGFTNINTGFDVTLNDTSESGTSTSKRYSGKMLHFGPRISIGYQYKKIKASLNGYIIEGWDLTGLTAIWLGGSLAYEIPLRRKNKPSH